MARAHTKSGGPNRARRLLLKIGMGSGKNRQKARTLQRRGKRG